MKKSELIKNPPVKVRRKKGTVYTGRRFKACGSVVIETDIYRDGQLILRHFTYKNGWQTYVEESHSWNTESLEWIMTGGQPYYFGGSDLYPSYEEAPYKKLSEDMDNLETSHMIERIESSVRWEKQKRASERKQERLDNQMDEYTPHLPRDFRRFIDKKMIGTRTALYKDGVIYCGACGKSMGERTKEKTGDMVACPSCGKKLIFNARKKIVEWSRGLQLFQEDNNGGYVERQFDVDYSSAPEQEEHIVITEVCRGFASEPGGIWNVWNYGRHRGCIDTAQQWWDGKKQSCISCLKRRFTLYDRNLEELPIEHNVLSTIKALEEYGIEFDWSYIIRRSRDYTFEAVCKSGIPGIAIQKAKGEAPQLPLEGYFTKLHEILCISRQQLRILREINGTYTSVMVMQTYKDITREELKIFEKHGRDYEKHRYLERLLGQHIPLTHVVTLIEKTAKVNRENLGQYCDYLDMAVARQMDIHDEIIYRNKRWKEYHDRYVEEDRIRKEREDAERKKKELYQKNHKYIGIKKDYMKNVELFGFEYGDYEFILPKKASDIVAEGQAQHNCVGASDNYIRKMATRQTFIIFMRKKETPKESFYTIEADFKRIIQAYSAYNRKVDWEEVEPVLKKWHETVKKRAKKVGAA